MLVYGYSSSQIEEQVINIRQFEDHDDGEEASDQEDEYIFQWMETLKQHPLNLNDPKIGQTELSFLPSHLAANFILYRNTVGPLLSIYELQAVPGFTVDVIKQLLPFVEVSDYATSKEKILKRFNGGQHVIVSRPTFPSRIYNRYKYQFGHELQYGLLTEKDRGEQSIADFYSFHLFTANLGVVKSLAIGDYLINMGQGLVHWQSQAFKKTSSVLNIKRQSPTIRPYHSAGEYNFQRGLAVTLQHRAWETTLFASFRKLSGSLSVNDEGERVISSINVSGLHRTVTEKNNKNNVLLQSYGMNCKNVFGRGHVGLNKVLYIYSLPLLKRDDPYNLYSIKGKQWTALSVDYSITQNNIHMFGEIAVANEKTAILNGLIASLHSTVDLAILYRKLDKQFQSIYGNAFTENTLPVNENGYYTGLSIHPFKNWKFDIYADRFTFPWLKYRVNAPSGGHQYFVQITWKPDKQTELYSQYRVKSKALNESRHVFVYPQYYIQKNLRTHLSFQASSEINIRSRFEICHIIKDDYSDPTMGFLMYGEVHFKPRTKPYSGNFRLQFFESDSYDARIYAYEQDVLYASSIPFFYRKGIRMYNNLKYVLKINKNRKSLININLKTSITFFSPYLSFVSQQNFETRLQCILNLNQ